MITLTELQVVWGILTKMSLAHLIKMSPAKQEEFFEKGIRFGKALQMINILRDIPEDLRFGRCYIPQEDLEKHNLSPEDLLNPNNIEKFRPLYDSYLDLTSDLYVAVEYIKMSLKRNLTESFVYVTVLIGQRTNTS